MSVDDSQQAHEEREDEAGYGPAAGESRGGFGRAAGFMPGSSEGAEDTDDPSGAGSELAEGGYPVGSDGGQSTDSSFGEPDAGDEARNPDY